MRLPPLPLLLICLCAAALTFARVCEGQEDAAVQTVCFFCNTRSIYEHQYCWAWQGPGKRKFKVQCVHGSVYKCYPRRSGMVMLRP